MPHTLPDYQVQLLADGLRGLFGDITRETLDAVIPLAQWIEVSGGEAIVEEGGTDDDIYCIISGRLRAYVGHGPTRRFLNDMRRGETIGEVSFFTNAARSATVMAMRDSVLVRLSRQDLTGLLEAYPQVMMNMARQIAVRLSRANKRRVAARQPANVCLLPITPLPAGVTLEGLGAALVQRLMTSGSALLLTSAKLGMLAGDPYAANVDRAQSNEYRRLTKLLDELESQHGTVIYVPDADCNSQWSQRCLRMADRVLLLADATATPAIAEVERRYLTDANRITEAEQHLVLLHAKAVPAPNGTAAWLDRRPVHGHLHLRPEVDRDILRLTRSLNGRSLSLVFSGGGARCFSQLGVLKALEEAGIHVDAVGGTSFGALMALMAAMDRRADDVIRAARESFRINPTGDIAYLPLTALIRGRQLEALIGEVAEGQVGAEAGIEDTWRNFFCVTANYSRAAEVLLTRGPLTRSLRASCAIPGLLPPVPLNGELMVDGGTFNRFPVDAALRLGAHRVIGVTVARDRAHEARYEEVPGALRLIRDKMAGRKSQYKLPSLMQILMDSATLYSASREEAEQEQADLCITLNLGRMDLLDWRRFDYAIDAGYKRTVKILAELPAEVLESYRN
jgi:NTE family protein